MPILMIHTITKSEITALDFSRFDSCFGDWPNLRGSELRCKYDALVLAVDGYNDHSEEIYLIPDVRKYFQEMHRRWPWLLYFLHDYDGSLAIVYMCLLNSVQCLMQKGKDRCAAIFEPAELLPILEVDFTRMNFLFERATLSDAENEKRTKQIFQTFLPQSCRP